MHNKSGTKMTPEAATRIRSTSSDKGFIARATNAVKRGTK